MKRLAASGPYLLLAASAALIVARWDAWPDVYPVHWGLRGPDRFAHLSWAYVARPLVAGLAFVAWLGTVRGHILRNLEPTTSGTLPNQVGAALRSAQWGMAAAFGAAAIPAESPAPTLVGVAVALLALPVALVAAAVARAGTAETPRSKAPADGWLYVPRRIGLGVEIARGHPRAWRARALLLVPPLALASAMALT